MNESLQKVATFEQIFNTSGSSASGSNRMNSSINVCCGCADDIIDRFSFMDVLTTNGDCVVVDVWELDCLDSDNGSNHIMELSEILSLDANCTAGIMSGMLEKIHYLKVIV